MKYRYVHAFVLAFIFFIPLICHAWSESVEHRSGDSELAAGDDPRLIYRDNEPYDGLESGKFIQDLGKLEQAARSGKVEAAVEIAERLIKCLNLPRSQGEMEKRIALARQYDNPQSSIDELNAFYEECRGVRKTDFNLIGYWLSYAAEQGHNVAMLGYGQYGHPYKYGISNETYNQLVEQWKSNVLRYLNGLIETEDPKSAEALIQLANIYRDGYVTEGDPIMSVSYLSAYETCTDLKLPHMFTEIDTKFEISLDNHTQHINEKSQRIVRKVCPGKR